MKLNCLFWCTSRIWVLVVLFLLVPCVRAAKVDTLNVPSVVMNKDIKAVIITPDGYNKRDSLPVVYLLHGYSDNYAAWVNKSRVKALADLYHCMIVCPDGNYNSWYFDCPNDKNFQYETYITKELITWVDGHYSTIRNRRGRAISGLSMGGHGALYLAFRHQDLFGAAGSMSGGVDLCPFPLNWEISDRLGSYAEHPEVWAQHSVINLVHLLTPNSLALIFDCGSEDFFYKANCRLHQKLLDRNIPHDFISRPGAHNWGYWANSIKFQMVFFNNFFNRKK